MVRGHHAGRDTVLCGICGIVNKGAQQYRIIIPEMLKAVAHRGPDEQGDCFF